MTDYPPEPPEAFPFEDEFRPSAEFETIIGHLREQLRASVRAEIIDELERLRSENAALRTKVEHLDFLEEAAKSSRLVYEEARRNALRTAQHELRRAKANNLLKLLATPKYRVVPTYPQGPKCDRCNENRCLEFVSPRGNTMEERCQCSETTRVYAVEEVRVVSIDHSQSDISIWYKEAEPSSHGVESTLVTLRRGDDVKNIRGDYHRYGFLEAGAAQEFADVLNSRPNN